MPFGRGRNRKSRSPFSLITLTNLENTDDYHRMGDVKSAEDGTKSRPNKTDTTWNEREMDDSSEAGINNARRTDVETGFKNGTDSRW